MIALIDYGSGNLRSAEKALARVGADVRIVSDRASVLAADAVVLPGVGAFGDCVRNLEKLNLADAIRQFVGTGRPFLGICVGLQMLFGHAEEGDVMGLEILPGSVPRFPRAAMVAPDGTRLKVPHMGWNQVQQAEAHPLWDGIEDGARFYFVHSYYVEPKSPEVIAGSTHYGIPFTSAIARANIFAVQFHPEKSAQAGLRLLSNFMRWNP